MNLKILFIILSYYTLFSIIFLFGGSIFTDYTYDNPINSTALSEDETDTGGLFSSGISFSRFLGLVTIGVGLPSSTPEWFSVTFMLWQTLWFVFTIGFGLSCIWDG